jgi:flavin prenyltransferase
MGMVVGPCSIRTVGEIASSAISNLLTRAKDVCLKERRRLVLMVRETPLHAATSGRCLPPLRLAQ